MDESAYTRIHNSLIAATVGAFVLIAATMGKTDNTSVRGFQIGYIVLFCIMLFKAIVSCSRIDKNDSSKISNIIQIINPFLYVLTIIFFIMILLNNNYDKITEGNISDYYTSFINLASILIFIQVILIFKELTPTNLYLSKKMATMIRLLGLLALISVITVHIVLKYYITDC
jgi:cytochrome bd-type quinol oxidase subunit 2